MIPRPVSPEPNPSTGARLVDAQGRALPLRGASLRADARAGLASVVLQHTYQNPHAEPLQVTYQVPLPADAAVSGFRFLIDGREVLGKVEPRAAARQRFEQAVLEGKTAALLDQDRSSLFTQEVGNVPPGAEVQIELRLDQKLAWHAEGDRSGWQWRFPTTVAPRFLGAPGRVADAQRVTTDVSTEPMPPRLQLSLRIRDSLTGRPDSSSHGLSVSTDCGEGTSVTLQGAALDRDVVVQWPVARPQPGVTADVARPRRQHPRGEDVYALLTVTPPAHRPEQTLPRDLVVLLDTSGSMHGEPLEQAKHVVAALLDSLDDADTVELVEFSDRPRRFQRKPKAATPGLKQAAHAWLAKLQAGGGTQMRDGIIEALAGWRDEAQRQVVLVTDGLIGFEEEIVTEIASRLPAGSRVHTLGIGSAVNRSLTGPAARAGRGQELIVALGEDPERAAARLVAATDAPVVIDVAVEGQGVLEVAPGRIPDLYAGAPIRVALRVRPEGARVRLSGRAANGTWQADAEIPATDHGQGAAAVTTLFARERVEDLEIDKACGVASLELDEVITKLGVDFQIATRLTSWIAVSDGAMVDPTDPTRREIMPHALPHGMSALGLGLRSALPMASGGPPPAPMATMIAQAAPPPAPASAPVRTRSRLSFSGGFGRADGGSDPNDEREAGPGAPPQSVRPPTFRSEPPPTMDGQLTRHGDAWVITFAASEDLAWEPPGDVELELADGSRIACTLESAISTKAAAVRAGASIRLVLSTPGEPSPPQADLIVAAHWQDPDGRSWEIRLTA